VRNNRFQAFAFKCNVYRYGADGKLAKQCEACPVGTTNNGTANAGCEFCPEGLTTVGRRTLCILLAPPPPRLIGWNICRPMRRLNGVCVGQ
jgi:hypothetical protein